MKQKWQSLSSREKFLLIGCGVAWLGWVGAHWVVIPLWTKYQAVTIELNTQTQQQKDLMQAIELKKLASDPAIQMRKLASLKEESKQLDQDLKAKLSGIAPVNRMAHWLESAMKGAHSLRLVSLKTLPSTPLSDAKGNRYFVHPLQMTFRGKYWDITHYLKALEQFSMKYHWQSLMYQVTEYPWAEVSLTVSGVSESRHWLQQKHSISPSAIAKG